jgi:hypothetical protein
MTRLPALPEEDDVKQEHPAAAVDMDLRALSLNVNTHVQSIQSTFGEQWTLTGLKKNKRVVQKWSPGKLNKSAPSSTPMSVSGYILVQMFEYTCLKYQMNTITAIDNDCLY